MNTNHFKFILIIFTVWVWLDSIIHWTSLANFLLSGYLCFVAYIFFQHKTYPTYNKLITVDIDADTSSDADTESDADTSSDYDPDEDDVYNYYYG